MSNMALVTPFTVGFQMVRRQALFVTLLPVVLLVIEALVFGLSNERFLSMMNLFNVMRQSAILLLVATGSSFVILVGSIDLSLGAVATLTAIATALVVRDYSFGLWALPVAMAIGLAAGAFNAALHLLGRIPSFLTTLGTMGIFTGVSTWLAGGANVVFSDSSIACLASGRMLLNIPNVALWSLALFLLCSLVAARTHFGRNLMIVGGGEAVAELSGVRVFAVKAGAFLMSGLLAGFAGFLLVARSGTGASRMGDDLMLDAIAAVVIGGTALSGGIGGVHRALFGVLVITVMSNGLNVSGVNPFSQIVIKGVVVVLAVALLLDRSKIEFVK
ncbi:ABC transporter permease [Paraburkholderia sp. LEh10]|uniref:ABC transporter permease n=1 Tax=Paraburkholderia sp. LEh10 TaxID=2821353 RepID=UPI001AE6A073|nr:ABC transporter permease [Paraburkholderia sp. LEh10]MBP0589463.1 ABC transporter permease [Paraburkholderia sp. LEh10]